MSNKSKSQKAAAIDHPFIPRLHCVEKFDKSDNQEHISTPERTMASALRLRTGMASAVAVAALALLASSAIVSASEEDKSNGFGGDIDWHSWEDMKSFDYSSNKKPIMYLFSKPWCGACKRLKSDFAEGSMKQKLEELSESFVMVRPP